MVKKKTKKIKKIKKIKKVQKVKIPTKKKFVQSNYKTNVFKTIPTFASLDFFGSQ